MPHAEGRRLGDADPLDSRLAAAQGQAVAAGPWWALRSRLALGMSPTPRPGLVLVTLGAALGPFGLRLLSPPVLTALDPVVSVALAALGVLVGLGLRTRRPGEGRLLAAASLQAALTTAAVVAGVLAIELLWLRAGIGTWPLAVMVGLCAAASSSAARLSDDDDTVAMRISDLDDVLPIVAGGFVLAMLHAESARQALTLTLAGGFVAAAVALAGWLLVGRSVARNEQRTFLAGTLLLVGGGAAYLSQSALFAGLIAGLMWNVAAGDARDRIARDLQALQHPLVVLLLLVAGARLEYSAIVLNVAVAYITCRVAGKVAGGWLAGRLVGRGTTPGLGLALVSPGVTGIAFAVNAVQADGDAARAAAVLAIVVTGSLASEMLSLVVRPREQVSGE
jgi:hypothetical protein